MLTTRLFIVSLLAATICPISALPHRRRVQASLKRSDRLGNITYTDKISHNNVSREENTNKTKTRILFRGELLGDFGDQDIIFPDTYQVIFENVPRINGRPECAKGITFCEDFDAYPYHHVKDVLKRKRVHDDLFGKDESPDERYSITNRNGDFEAYVCASVSKTVFPRIGKNKNNKWKYIINQEEAEGYIQGVRVEICKKAGAACDVIGDIPSGYITSCKQKYMLRRLMSLSDNGDPFPDTFQLPSACCCSYRKDLSFLTRFGSTDVSARNKYKDRPL